jgi:hypothetical protein
MTKSLIFDGNDSGGGRYSAFSVSKEIMKQDTISFDQIKFCSF